MSPTIEEVIKGFPEFKEWDRWDCDGAPLYEQVEDVLSCEVTLRNKLIPLTPEQDADQHYKVTDWRSVNLRRIRITATAWKVEYDEVPLEEVKDGS